ncbi:MAG: prepilin-type N-terminal cleavage/methylation domain-containing protein [Candidatus Riflebacteria bacterium]
MPVKNKKQGFTLVEVIMSVLVSSVVILFLSRLLLGGMQISRSGGEHLSSLMASDIILQYFSEDLQQTVRLVSDETQLINGKLILEIIERKAESARPNKTLVQYNFSADRKVLERKYSDTSSRELFPERQIDLKFSLVEIDPEKQKGLVVELKVGNRPDFANSHTLKRFFYLPELRENQLARSCYQTIE